MVSSICGIAITINVAYLPLTPHSDEQYHHQDSSSLSFTPYQNKSLLALLQQSSNFTNHNVNHVTTQLKFNTSIIGTTPINVAHESFILDTRATTHVCFSRTFFLI